jgi:hypothetical protein
LERGGTEPALLYRQCNENHELGRGYFVQNRIISAVKRAEFISGRMLYITVSNHWRDFIVPNVHAPTEDTIDYVKGSF